MSIADPYYASSFAPAPPRGMIGAIPARSLNDSNIEGGEPRTTFENPYRDAGSLVDPDRVRRTVQTPKPVGFYARLKYHDAPRVRDLPVMVGGGVLGMIAGEALSVSTILQWALVGAGITFGVLISVIEWSKHPTLEPER